MWTGVHEKYVPLSLCLWKNDIYEKLISLSWLTFPKRHLFSDEAITFPLSLFTFEVYIHKTCVQQPTVLSIRIHPKGIGWALLFWARIAKKKKIHSAQQPVLLVIIKSCNGRLKELILFKKVISIWTAIRQKPKKPKLPMWTWKIRPV